VALKLLRAGAEVTVTTRFPVDAQHRFAAEPDAPEWIARLAIIGADFLRGDDVARVIESVRQRWGHLDILVNNAAQTIQRPAEYFREVSAGEERASPALGPVVLSSRGLAPAHSNAAQLHTAALTDSGFLAAFPAGEIDETGEQLDLRNENSWSLHLHDVEPTEWIESHVVSALVPFLLIRGLRSHLLGSPNEDRYVVNVSAMEGNFSRPTKTPRHPHTNAAKAALNMITRTSGESYAADGIHMTSVDTGWITDERAHPEKCEQRDIGFRPPLDVVDGAARICHPIFAGINGTRFSGVFLKDYEVSQW